MKLEAIQNQVTVTHIMLKEMKETVDKVCDNLNLKSVYNKDFAGKEANKSSFEVGGYGGV